MVPSRRSENTNAVITRTPTRRSPCGKNQRAATTTPSVPTTVTASGLTFQRSRSRATGEIRFVKKARRCSNMARAGYGNATGPDAAHRRRPSWSVPGVREQLPRLGHELWQGPGPADDRHEVLVAGPARDDMLVQVRRDPRTRDGALVHAQVEAVRAADRPDRAHGRLGHGGDLMRLVVGELGVVRNVTVRTHHQVTG